MKPLISIIVPVYNVESYLKRCIDSLINQTLNNIEIILVDDGSTDSSGKLVDEFSKSDNRIKVVHKTNGGLSSARNAGMEIATGEYIGFVDSDDWVELEMYERLYSEAKSKAADIVMCGYHTTLNGKVSSKVEPPHSVGFYDRESIINEFALDILGLEKLYTPGKKNSVFATVWVHIYKSELIKSNKIIFTSEREIYCEDHFFNYQTYLKAKSLCVIHYIGYNYETRIGSLSKCYRKNLWERKKLLLKKMTEIVKQNNLYERCRERIKNQYLNIAIEAINNESIPKSPINLSKSINTIKEITYDKELVNILSAYSTKRMSMYGKIIIFSIKHHFAWVLYFGYALIYKLHYR